jgi:hypothetical protein
MKSTPAGTDATARRPARSGVLSSALAFVLVGALLIASSAEASKGVLSTFGTPNGAGAGQLEAAEGVAINRTGAGGAGAGDVYVAEGNDGHRVQQFDAEGNPVRIFGWNVVASGPDNVTPASAVQSVNVPASVTGGTFTLTFNGKTTPALPFNASAAEVQSALVALSSVGEGSVIINNVSVTGPNVEVTGGPGASAPYAVTFAKYLSNTPVPTISANSSNLAGGSASVSVATAGISGYEVCDVKANPTDVCQAGDNGLVQAGALLGPEGVAVDQANGNLYVTDGTNNRVDVYSATGNFEGAFGWGVVNGSREAQFCTTICMKGVGGKLTGNGGSLEGGGAGQFDGQIGHPDVAPAGSPHEGDLYIADARNNRIDEFKPTLSGGVVTGVAFVRAFGWDVVESGPDNIPAANEVQTIAIPAAVTGGTFTVSFEGETTAAIPYNVSNAQLREAINTLSSINKRGFASVSGGLLEHLPYKISFEGSLEESNLPQFTVDSSKLLGGEATVQTLTQGVGPYEVCEPAAHPGDICKAGKTGPHDGQLSSPKDVGVDSSGGVYAVEGGGNCNPRNEMCRVEKYNPNGSFSEEFAPAQLNGILNQSLETAPVELAIDPADSHIFVAKKSGTETAKILEFDSSGNLLDSSPASGGFPARSASLAVGSEERLYLASRVSGGAGSQVLILGPPPAPSATIGPVTGVTATSATFSGTVKPPTPGLFGGFATFYRFEYSTDGISWSKAPAEEDAEVGDGSGAGSPNGCPTGNPPSCNVSQTVTGLQPGASYQVRLVATTGTSFTTPAATFATKSAPPSVSGTLAEEVEETTAKLTGFVNPNNQPTTYHFEWGTTTAYGNDVPNFDAFTGSGGKAAKVSAPLAGLEPHTAYHFRIVASNGLDTSTGPDEEFTTLDEAGLPDNRRAELVSPADKRPQGKVFAFEEGFFLRSSEDGRSFSYKILNGLLDASAGGEVQYLAHRGESGWSSEQLSAPDLVPAPVDGGGSRPSLVQYLTPDLSCGLISSYEPLTPDVPKADLELGVSNLYRINPDGSHTLITATVPSNPTLSGDEIKSFYEVAGMSSDCNHAYFSSQYKLLPGASGLYEWDEGTLRDAGVLPDETVAAQQIGGQGVISGWAGPTFIGGVGGHMNAVSRDGRRLFFTSTSDEGADEGQVAVFVREDGDRTVDASQSTTATAPLGARYELASKDGSHVFFRANYGLTPDSSAGPSSGRCTEANAPGRATPCDLYSYDTEAETLTDLSADHNPADTKGAVVEGVLDASDNGSDVYFAALGQLVPNQGNTYKQNLAGRGFANVYLSHEGNLSYVGVVTQGDLVALDLAQHLGNNQRWISQATPDGAHLLFDSSANVTGYASGGTEEAYLYSAESGKTVCVSCRRDGEPPLESTSPYGPIAPGETGEPDYITRSRSLSDDGSRVFFTMRDPLAPRAIAGNQNIYEWEKGQVYLLSDGKGGAKFVDSSASGNDVFLTSTEQLDAHDTDFVADAYDLRVGGGYPPPAASPPPCEPAKDQCQGTPVAPPPASAAPSASFAGAGNPPLPAAEKPKQRKHKKHRHKAHKHQSKQAKANRGGQK